jgi:NAD(P)-dependent dehydrogenase (short-subunit alcohol dehydrogenase family)
MGTVESIPQLFNISDMVIALTGAGGELCGTMAERLTQLGCRVAILDINLEAAKKREQSARAAAGKTSSPGKTSAAGDAKAFQCDVLDEDSLRNCYREICSLWGRVDALINGAGGNNPRGSTDKEFLESEDLDDPDLKGFFDLDFTGFSQTFNLNFLGTFLPTRILTRGMAERRRGGVVNISSMSALNPLTKVGAYSAAKAAVANFTRWLAVHFSHVGIRVNALAPGFFMTEQLRFLHIDQKTGELTPRAKQVIAHTPMGRYGEPEDLVGTVVWLLSEASRFVTGAVIPIDGGFSSYSI